MAQDSCQDGPKLTPRWLTILEDGPTITRSLHMAPRWPQDGPEMAPRLPREGPGWPLDGPSWPQDGSKTAQNSPEIDSEKLYFPLGFYIFSYIFRYSFVHRRVLSLDAHKMPPRPANINPRWLKTNRKRAQVGTTRSPSWRQDELKMAPRWPTQLPNRRSQIVLQ